MISQEDIAQKLQLSRATISLALAGNPRIPAITRKRVQALARKLGYKANRNAVLLATQRRVQETASNRPNIAYMQPLGCENGKDHYLPGLLRQSEALGYHLDIFHSWKFPSNDHLNKVLHSRGIQGVIVGQTNGDFRPYIPPFDQIAVVQCGFFMPVEIHALVRSDLEAAVRLCFEKVRARSFPKIGMVLLKNPAAASDKILETTIWDLKRIYPDEVEVFIEDWTIIRKQLESLEKWFFSRKIDAVVGVTASVDSLLQSLKIEIPFACMIFDPHRPYCDGADIQSSVMGEMSINLLDSFLRQNVRGIPTVKKVFMVEPTWREGTSLSRPRMSLP